MTEAGNNEINNPNVEEPLTTTQEASDDPASQFRGVGINFKAKLIGIDKVVDSRGDKMCQDSILKLKSAVKISGQHKQKILLNISLDGVKISDLLTGEVQSSHPINKISFVARDLTDRRAFAYIFSTDDGGHELFGIKTAKAAETVVLSLRDLFQVVYDMRMKELENDSSQTASNQQFQQSLISEGGGNQKLGEMLQTIESIEQFKEGNMLGDSQDASAADLLSPEASGTVFLF